MIRIDPNKVRHVTEPDYFDDMRQDYGLYCTFICK